MKTLPLLLLLSCLGCDHSARDLKLRQASEQARQWVPFGTPPELAQKTMEQHQFSCSVHSYDSVEQMQKERPEQIEVWKQEVIRDHIIQPVKNVTDFECKNENEHLLIWLARSMVR